MPYSAVTQPLPVLRRKGGTRSSTVAVHSTCVSPNLARQEPSAYLAILGSRETERIVPGARPEGRITGLSKSRQLVDLQAQLPLRVGAAEFHSELGVVGAIWSVHRLDGKAPEL
jgi:hypothetical protein